MDFKMLQKFQSNINHFIKMKIQKAQYMKNLLCINRIAYNLLHSFFSKAHKFFTDYTIFVAHSSCNVFLYESIFFSHFLSKKTVFSQVLCNLVTLIDHYLPRLIQCTRLKLKILSFCLVCTLFLSNKEHNFFL
jgi:hypothetical protein